MRCMTLWTRAGYAWRLMGTDMSWLRVGIRLSRWGLRDGADSA